MALNILTDAQVSEYIAGLDLAQGSEAYRTLNAMLLLPKPAFAKAVSAMAQGLIDLSAMRALPAMNERLVDALIASRLGENDPSTLAWKYREQWLPASIDVGAMRTAAIGNAAAAIAAKFVDRWGGVIRSNYDFLKTDETRFHSYAEAYVGYMVIANGAVPVSAVRAFDAFHAQYRADHPELLHAEDALCPVLRLVDSMLTDAVFLERQTGGRKPYPLLDWVVGASWRSVLPGNYNRFLSEIAYPAMASADDPGHTGRPGMELLSTMYEWPPIGNDGDPGWELDRARMANIHLPAAYGADVAQQKASDALCVAYLEAARTAILSVHDFVAREMQNSALPYRAVPGSPMGLLLCITSP
jgi:hypothetical protein